MNKEIYHWEVYFAYQDNIYDQCIEILELKENSVNINHKNNIVDFSIIAEKELNIDLTNCNFIEFGLIRRINGLNDERYKKLYKFNGNSILLEKSKHNDFWKHRYQIKLDYCEIKTSYLDK